MRTIQLTKGLVTLVDDADYEWLSQWKWHATGGKYGFYAVRFDMVTGRMVRMHRFILNAPEQVEVDHRDLNRLNNQRYNLRLASQSQNRANVAVRKDNCSGFKGVGMVRSGRWRARMQVNGKSFSLGQFDTKEAAALAYQAAAVSNFGEFARW